MNVAPASTARAGPGSLPGRSPLRETKTSLRSKLAQRAAFALPLVMLVSFFAVGALAIMMERQSAVRLAVARQVDGYRQHHTQAGLRQLLSAWSQLYVYNDERRQAKGVIGVDIILDSGATGGGGGKVELRLYDAQGPIRRRTVDLDPDVNDVLTAAAQALAGSSSSRAGSRGGQRGTSASAMDGLPTGDDLFRDRGPGQVSLDSASPEVLAAIATAVDPSASGKAFADAVVQFRADKRIAPADVRNLTLSTGLPEEKLRLLEQCLVAEPSLWMAIATLTTPSGEVLERQGGLVLGIVKNNNSRIGQGARGGMTTLPATNPSGSPAGSSTPAAGLGNGPGGTGGAPPSNWTVLRWGDVDERSARRFLEADRKSKKN